MLARPQADEAYIPGSFFSALEMIAFLLLAIGALFFVWLFTELASRELQARGWGFGVRTYHRDEEPGMYWFHFAQYLLCAVVATVFGLMAAFGRSF